MSDPKHPTNGEWELFDPLIKAPPLGANLLLINEGGTLIVGPWYQGAQAWGFKPKLPASVKQRIRERLQKQKEESESLHGSQPEGGPADPA